MDKEKTSKLWDNELNQEEMNEILNDPYFDLSDKKSLISKLEKADRAHITLGVSKGNKSVQSGLDQLNIMLRVKYNESMKRKIPIVETDNYKIAYLDNCFCFVKLKNKIKIKSIFTGDY